MSGESSKHSDINIVSWNVRGINTPLKRGKVYAHLRTLKAEICFLQETHIKKTAAKVLRPSWASHVFQSNFSTKSRGVAILIKKQVPFVHTQTISDDRGRYLLVIGELNSVPVTLINAYGPNFDDPVFFQNLFNSVPNVANTNIILGGDLNCVLDSVLDRQHPQAITSKSSITLNNLIQSHNLVDVWRLLNPTGRDFSYFSAVHKSYSRIDYFILDSKLLPQIVDCTYHNILISDHAPVSLKLKLNPKRGEFNWRLNNTLLKDKEFCSYLSSKTDLYLNTNDNGEVDDSTLWEAMKAVLRGHIISYEAAERRRSKEKLTEIDNQLSDLEALYKQNNKPETLRKITALKYDYNSILSKNVSRMLTQVRQRYFEFGDKPQRLLARQLRQAQASRAIHSIRTNDGTVLTDPGKINKCFASFYESIYQSQGEPDPAAMESFFGNLGLPRLSGESSSSLDADINLNEIKKVISSFPNNKAAGPDGFSIEFFKVFSSKLSPLVLRMLNHSMLSSRLPPTLYKANISLIPKPGRDPNLVSSYRPISLLSIETKILGKILANRLKEHICSIIHPDQTGFMPGRHMYFNLRRLFHVLFTEHEKEAVVISLDAQRAFDQVEWPYMLFTLKKFGFGPSFIKWIELIYSHPTASVITNQNISRPFAIRRGTRQGCPLSPFLFSIVIEPLAASIRKSRLISPIVMNEQEHQISLYADDILLFLSRPQTSIPHLLTLISNFGKLSGFSVNWDKSEIMPISEEVDITYIQSTPFKKAFKDFSYLGVTVTRDSEDLLPKNWHNKIEQLKQDIHFWKTLPISLAGKINAIKMIVLPRFLHLFQSIPCFIPQSYFKQLDSIIIPFIWNYKAVRITKKHLCKSKNSGGFALPNFKMYYWAAHLSILAWWRSGPSSSSYGCPTWLCMERLLCQKTSLLALLNSPTKVKKLYYSNSFVINGTLRTWEQIKLHIKAPSIYLDTPICENHAFTPGLNDIVFSAWKHRGISKVSDLYIEGNFASFTQLQATYNISASSFFRYLQIRDFVKKNMPNFEVLNKHDTLEAMNKFDPATRGAVSLFYRILHERALLSTEVYREAWADELNMELSDENWEECLRNVHKCSVNVRHNLIQFKTLHRLHYSQEKLHKIYPTVSPMCNRCKSTISNLAHSFWSCSKLHSYWKNIFNCFSEAFGKSLEPNPLVAVLGATSVLTSANKREKEAIQFGMVIAKKLILRVWKMDFVPTYDLWLGELANTLHLERLRFYNEDRGGVFDKTWDPVLRYLKGQDR